MSGHPATYISISVPVPTRISTDSVPQTFEVLARFLVRTQAASLYHRFGQSVVEEKALLRGLCAGRSQQDCPLPPASRRR